MLSKKQAYKNLEKKFRHFIEAHDFTEVEKEMALDAFIKGEEIIKPFDKAFSWHCSKRGYDFFYFLSLRWMMMLIKYSKLYQELYSCDIVIKTLWRILKYSDIPRPTDKWDITPYTRDNYDNFFYKQRGFYFNFLQKNYKKFGN